MDYSLRKVMKITVMIKISFLILIYLGYHFLAFNFENQKGNSIGPAPPFGFESTLETWDAQHYLFLAEHGYAPGQMSNAFYPLFPYLIKVVGIFFLNHTLLAGLALSHLFTFFAMIYFYRLIRQKGDEVTAFWACLFLLAFPAGFYLGLVYTESLFLALAVALFYYMGEKRIGLAFFCALLLPLTRPTGLLVGLPVLVGLWGREYFKTKEFRFAKWLVPTGFVIGYGVYLTGMKLWTGDYFAATAAEKLFLTNYSMSRLFHPLDWFMMNFLQTDFSVAGLHSSLLNRLWFVAYLLVLVLARKYLSRTLFVYSLVLGLIPALSGDFASYVRYLVVLFPLFIFMAIRFKNNAEYYLLASLSLQALFALAHCLYNWVA